MLQEEKSRWTTSEAMDFMGYLGVSGWAVSRAKVSHDDGQWFGNAGQGKLSQFIGNMTIPCFGNAADNASQGVRVTPKADGQSQGMFIAGAIEKGSQGFWDGFLASWLEMVGRPDLVTVSA